MTNNTNQSTAQHTPGPWEIADDGEKPAFICVDGLRPDGSDTVHICTFESAYIANELKANANLIASAPELLEIVKEMFANWDYYGPKDSYHYEFKTKMQQVIAEAEGRA